HASAASHDRARSVRAQYAREARSLGTPRAGTHVRIPGTDSGRVHGDQNVARADARNEELVSLQNGRKPEPVNRGRSHRRWKRSSDASGAFLPGAHEALRPATFAPEACCAARI